MIDEERRIAALNSYDILDTPYEDSFDDFTRLVAHVCEAPIAVINLVDRDRQWFKSHIGLGVRETGLDISICKHAILQKGLFVVPDTTRDSRFQSNPLVTGEPHLRFYAGALLESDEGLPLGTLCVLDYQPRQLTKAQEDALGCLARQVMVAMELRRKTRRLEEELIQNRRLRRDANDHRFHVQRVLDGLHHPFISVDSDQRVVYLNQEAARLFRLPEEDLSGRRIPDLLGGALGERLSAAFAQSHIQDKLQSFRYAFPDDRGLIEVRVVPRAEGASVLVLHVTGEPCGETP